MNTYFFDPRLPGQSEDAGGQQKTQSAKMYVLAERVFDPRTFGLWAQHANHKVVFGTMRSPSRPHSARLALRVKWWKFLRVG